MQVVADEVVVAAAASSVFVNCTQYFGKGLRAAPRAYWDDGLLDVIALEPKTRGETIRVLNSIKAGGGHQSLCKFKHAKQCQISFPETREDLFMIDGEVFQFDQGNGLTISVVPGAINFLCPKHVAVNINV
jgi:diacylglycerol kinase family enzyme